MKKTILLAIPILAIVLFASGGLHFVKATATLSPDEVSTLKGFSVTFEYKNPANASTTLYYRVKDSSGTVVESSNFDTDANGEGTFTVSFDSSGEFTVQVGNSDFSKVYATATVHVIDLIAIIMPILILVIMLTVVFNVADEIQGILK